MCAREATARFGISAVSNIRVERQSTQEAAGDAGDLLGASIQGA